MKQSTKNAESLPVEQNPAAELLEQFENVKASAQFREVKLKYKSCCSCGCSDVTILRTVPMDSKLKDGDRVKKLENDDELL